MGSPHQLPGQFSVTANRGRIGPAQVDSAIRIRASSLSYVIRLVLDGSIGLLDNLRYRNIELIAELVSPGRGELVAEPESQGQFRREFPRIVHEACLHIALVMRIGDRDGDGRSVDIAQQKFGKGIAAGFCATGSR
jgi:hypothetical protein